MAQKLYRHNHIIFSPAMMENLVQNSAAYYRTHNANEKKRSQNVYAALHEQSIAKK